MRSFIQGLAIVAMLIGPATGGSAAESNHQQKAQQLAKVLKQSGKLKGYRVAVKYEDGVAWLTGTVTSKQQKLLAEQVIQNDAGVKHVVSKLEVVPSDTRVRQASNNVSRRGNQLAPRRQASRPAPRQMAPRQRRMARPMGRPMPQPHAAGRRPVRPANYAPMGGGAGGAPRGGGMAPRPTGHIPSAVGQSVSYDNPQLPGYAWPSYSASPNYAALTYPKQYSPSAWPYIGPFYPYPQKVSLEWDDGWWFLDFND